jgi:hypothetical protein
LAAATNRLGCSAQYAEYSVKEVPERMKGGAVNEERSPLKEAIDFKKLAQDPLLAGGMADCGSLLELMLGIPLCF